MKKLSLLLFVFVSVLMADEPPFPDGDEGGGEDSQTNVVSKWKLFNNNSNGVSMAFTSNTISGTFPRTTSFHYVGDTKLGGYLRRSDGITGSFNIRVNLGQNFDGMVQIGHFGSEELSSAATDFVGLHLQEGYGSQPNTLRAKDGKIDAKTKAIHFPNPVLSAGNILVMSNDVDHRCTYGWDPTGGTNSTGRFTLTLTPTNGTPLVTIFEPTNHLGFRVNAWGISAGYASSSSGATNNLSILVTDPVYTVLPKPTAVPKYMREIVLFGQSNARGGGAEYIVYTNLTDFARTNTFMFKEGEWVFLRPGDPLHNWFGPEMSMCARLADKWQEPVGVIPWTIGGNGLEETYIPGKVHYPKLVSLVKEAMAAAPNSIFYAAATVNGENDSNNSGYAARYYTNMVTLMTALRNDLNLQEFPLVLTRIPTWATVASFKTNVRAGQMALTNWVDTDFRTGLYEGSAHIHFTAADQLGIGEDFAAKLLEDSYPRFARAGGELLLLTHPDFSYSLEQSEDLDSWYIQNLPNPLPSTFLLNSTNQYQFFQVFKDEP